METRTEKREQRQPRNAFEAAIAETGYEVRPTFWDDFTMKEDFGVDAVRDTYRAAFMSWRDNAKYLAELVMALDRKIWWWYKRDSEMAELYERCWREAEAWGRDNLRGDDNLYYLRTTD